MFQTVSKDESYFFNSEKIPIEGNKKYKVDLSVSAKKGQKYSAFIGVFILGSTGLEYVRHIRWLTDFTGKPKNYSIIFKTDTEAKNAVIGYRFNQECPLKTDLEIEISNQSSLKLVECDMKIPDSFDNRKDYLIPTFPPLSIEQEDDLEKKMVWVFGSIRSGTSWLVQRMLEHPQNIIWNEPMIGVHLGNMVEHKDYEKGPKISRSLSNEEKRDDYFFCRTHHKNNWLPYLRKLILARTYSHAQSLQNSLIFFLHHQNYLPIL